MPTITDQAIPIRLWDYSETSQTACLFARDSGVLRGLAKGSKREKSNFSGGFEVLTRGEVVAIVRPSADLANIIEWDLQHVYAGARASLATHHAALYMIDLIYHTVTDHDPHPALFDALDAQLDALSGGGGSPVSPSLLRFQWSLLEETGYRPRLDEAPDRPRGPLAFDPARATLVPDPGPDSDAPVWRVRPGTVAVLKGLERGGTPGEGDGGGEGEAVDRAGRLLSEYLRHLLSRDLPTRALVYPGPTPPRTPMGGRKAGRRIP